MRERPSTGFEGLVRFALAALAATIAVRGAASIIPDAILLDKYGDVHGVFQLAGCVLGLVTLGGVLKALDGPSTNGEQ